LDGGVDQGPERRPVAVAGEGVAVGGDAGPEVEGVGVLPVVDLLVGFFGGVGDASAEVDCELPDECEAGGVADVLVHTPEFGG
jgi:hypothetical protein